VWARVEPRPSAKFGTLYRAYWYLDGRKQASPTYGSMGDAAYVADWVNGREGRVLSTDPALVDGSVFDGTPAERAPEPEPAAEPDEPALPVTLGHWLDVWLAHAKARRVRPQTLANYRTQCARLAPWRALDVTAWVPSDSAEILDGLEALYAPSVVYTTYVRVMSAHKAARAAGVIVPVIEHPLGSIEFSSPGQYLTPAQVTAICDGLAGQRADIARVLVATGMRIGEALALRCVDIDPVRGGVMVDETAVANSPGVVNGVKNKKRRFVPVAATSEAWRILTRARLGGEPAAFIFRRGERAPMTAQAFRARFRDVSAALVEAGVLSSTATPHDFRHTAGSHLIFVVGIKPAAVALMLGHSLEQLERTYMHADRSVEAQLAAGMSSVALASEHTPLGLTG
jgi:integrase